MHAAEIKAGIPKIKSKKTFLTVISQKFIYPRNNIRTIYGYMYIDYRVLAILVPANTLNFKLRKQLCDIDIISHFLHRSCVFLASRPGRLKYGLVSIAWVIVHMRELSYPESG